MNNPFRENPKLSTQNNLTSIWELKIRKIELIIAIVALVGGIVVLSQQLLNVISPSTCDSITHGQHIGGMNNISTENGHIFHIKYIGKKDSRYIYKTRTFQDTLSPHLLPQFVEKIKRPSSYQFAKDLVKEDSVFPLKININELENLLQEEEKLQKGIFTHSDLDKIFLIACDSLEYNCKTKKYSYTMGVAIPRFTNSYLPRLRGITFKHIEKLELLNHSLNAVLDQKYDFGKVMSRLLEHTEFEKKFCIELKGNSSYYSLFEDLGSNNYSSCQLSFELGDYSLHPAGIATLEYFGDLYAREITRNPKKTYTITCFGYTNSLPVGKIPYNGNGRWDIPGYKLGYGEESISDGNPIPDTIRHNHGNLQLSYARSYNGIKYLANYMKDVHRDAIKDTNIEFNYVGMGIDQSMAHNENNAKRIEIQLSQNSKY